MYLSGVSGQYGANLRAFYTQKGRSSGPLGPALYRCFILNGTVSKNSIFSQQSAPLHSEIEENCEVCEVGAYRIPRHYF